MGTEHLRTQCAVVLALSRRLIYLCSILITVKLSDFQIFRHNTSEKAINHKHTNGTWYLVVSASYNREYYTNNQRAPTSTVRTDSVRTKKRHWAYIGFLVLATPPSFVSNEQGDCCCTSLLLYVTSFENGFNTITESACSAVGKEIVSNSCVMVS
jgi:hypothetical protein